MCSEGLAPQHEVNCVKFFNLNICESCSICENTAVDSRGGGGGGRRGS